eukprot:s614_g22.t3
MREASKVVILLGLRLPLAMQRDDSLPEIYGGDPGRGRGLADLKGWDPLDRRIEVEKKEKYGQALRDQMAMNSARGTGEVTSTSPLPPSRGSSSTRAAGEVIASPHSSGLPLGGGHGTDAVAAAKVAQVQEMMRQRLQAVQDEQQRQWHEVQHALSSQLQAAREAAEQAVHREFAEAMRGQAMEIDSLRRGLDEVLSAQRAREELQGHRAEALAEELAGARQAVHRLEAQSEDFQSRLQSQMQEMERMRADTQECLRENDACARERALLSQRLQEVEAGLGDVRNQLREHGIEIEKLKAIRANTKTCLGLVMVAVQCSSKLDVERHPGLIMDIVVVATFQDFDETQDKRQRGPGCDRKKASQALIRHLCAQPQEVVRKVDVLVLDWKAPPKQGPKDTSVLLGQRETEKSVVWGSREQLLTKFPASVWDLCICSSTARLVLDLAGQLKVKRRLALQHDYNLPFGPWGQEQTPDQLKEHRSLLKGFELLCASQHLVDFVEKWGEGDFRARCCYAADFSLFDPLPQEPLQPWEGQHSFVTFVSPCPEKGLSIFLRLAEALPDVQFLAVKTVTWTKPWHEQILKKYRNVKVQTATEKIEEVLKVTKVLLAPSVYPEAFALVVTEAQLRGIPVVSTRSGGLAEANCVAQTAVADIPIVFDQRTHELVLGMSIDEAENSLSVDRPGALTMEQWRQTAITQENYQKVAEESDVQKLMEVLQGLLAQGGGPLRQASQDARIAATSFVERRRGQLLASLRKILAEIL